MDGSQSRFQVLSLDTSYPTVSDYKRRKVHTKSKSGCLTCKVKRVKCDESRPVCVRCQRNNRPCAYTQPASHRQELVPSNKPGANVSILSSVTVIPFFSPSAKNGTSSIHLMKHFHAHWAEIFQIPRSHEIITLTKSNSLVRNLILAIAAAHLRHVAPGALQHRIAEHFQQSLALEDYKKALNSPVEMLGQSGVDTILLGGTLLNILAFPLPECKITATVNGEPDPNTSWVFNPHTCRLQWLSLLVGFRPLLKSVTMYLEETLSFLAPLFFGGGQGNWEFLRMNHALEGVPKLWIRFFELNDDGHGCDYEKSGPGDTLDQRPNNPHHADMGEILRAPVVVLAQLQKLEPVSSNVFRNFQFLSKVNPEFQVLLYWREEKALWLFGYWLGIMCRFKGIWWCYQRAKRDYKAISMWLRQLHLPQRPGDEGLMWAQMLEELELAPTFVRR